MEVKFNVTGERRKEMVQIISGIVGMCPVYMRMPTCSYVINNFTVTKDGTIQYDDRSTAETVEKVLTGLAQVGFKAETSAEEPRPETTAAKTESSENETYGLTVELPLDAVQVGNLTNILEAKGSLIKKALGVDDLRFEIKVDRIAFQWFESGLNSDEVNAYSKFIFALCKMAKSQKRNTLKEKEVENEKYAFRCFLLRLGFIGNEFKSTRKILLRNLSGSSAFRNGGAENAVSE